MKKYLANIFGRVDETVDHVESRVDSFVLPVRKTVFERFPVVFTLLVTFGVVTTFKGIDLLVAELPSYMQQPLVLLTLGILILAFTGTLYKKLG